MKVSDQIINASFETAGVSRAALHDALREMCPAALKANDKATTQAMRRSWTHFNPTRFTCYFVSEMVFWFLAPKGSTAMAVEVSGDSTLHRFVRWPDGRIVDLTCDQFDDYSLVQYQHATQRMFMQTGGFGPSKRARQLAALLDLPNKNQYGA